MWRSLLPGRQHGQIRGYQVHYVRVENGEARGLPLIKDVMLADAQVHTPHTLHILLTWPSQCTHVPHTLLIHSKHSTHTSFHTPKTLLTLLTHTSHVLHLRNEKWFKKLQNSISFPFLSQPLRGLYPINTNVWRNLWSVLFINLVLKILSKSVQAKNKQKIPSIKDNKTHDKLIIQ